MNFKSYNIMDTQTQVEGSERIRTRGTMSQNNVPLDRSSDKSSDSGGLLDLSSRALSDGDETWLFTMEAMKGI